MITVKAFTVLEMMVAMVIASVIISFSYLGLQTVNKQLSLYKNATKQIMQAATLAQVLGSDFDRCEFASIDGNSIKLSNKNGRIVTYVFGEAVIRNAGEVTDTFNIQLQGFQAKGYTLSIQNINPSLINEISFKIKLFSSYQDIHFVKFYPAKTLLELTAVKSLK